MQAQQVQYDKIRKLMKLRRVKMLTGNEGMEHCQIHDMDFPTTLDCPRCKCDF